MYFGYTSRSPMMIVEVDFLYQGTTSTSTLSRLFLPESNQLKLFGQNVVCTHPPTSTKSTFDFQTQIDVELEIIRG